MALAAKPLARTSAINFSSISGPSSCTSTSARSNCIIGVVSVFTLVNVLSAISAISSGGERSGELVRASFLMLLIGFAGPGEPFVWSVWLRRRCGGAIER